MNRRDFLAIAIAAWAIISPLSAAILTNKYVLTNSAWTDLGAGPLLLSFRGQGFYAVSDAAPSLTDGGFARARGGSIRVNTTSHVWAMAGSAANVNVYVAPITPGAPTHSPQALAYLARTVGGNEGGAATNIANLIDGLVTDGVWSLLDCLYVLAQQNATDAALNLIGTSYSLGNTGAGGNTFTSYVGVSGFTTSALTTGFNPSTAPTPHFIQLSASSGFWAYNTPDGGHGIGDSNGQFNQINANFTGNLFYARVNSTVTPSVASPGTRGLYAGDRSANTGSTSYYNGVSKGTVAGASTATTWPFFLGNDGSGKTTATISVAFIGASLGGAGQLALYNRLRTYLTAVGVP